MPHQEREPMYKNIVFDIDGTIVDTERACVIALQMLAKTQLRRDISEDECRFSIGIPGSTVFPVLGIDYNEDTLAEWNNYYAGLIGETKIFDGIQPLLQTLKQRGLHLGLVSSRSHEEMDFDPNMQKLCGYFEVAVLADDTEEHKPTPMPMLHYLKTTGAKPEETIYIGDTIYDWQCAKGAGVDFALAVWGAPTTEGIGAQYMVNTPEELLAIL